MLEFIRNKKDSVLVKIFLGFLALSFGIWGVGDFMGSSRLSPGVALKAGDAELKTQVVQRRFVREMERFREAMGGRSLDEDLIKRSVMAQMMQDLTHATVLDAAAMGLGITITRDQVREAIVKNENFQQNGQFNQMLFDQALNGAQLSEQGYIDLVTADLRSAEVMQPIAANTAAPQYLVDQLFAYRNEGRTADTILVPFAAMALQSTPKDDELKAVYDKNIAAFTAPEYRKLSILVLNAQDLIKPESIDEADVKAYYDQNTARYQAPETRHLEQLVFDTKEKAEAARALAAPGDTLETLATKAKADPPVDLGELSDSMPLAATIGKTPFSLPVHEISQPVQTDLGWHLFEVKSITPASSKAFDAVKDEIRKNLAADKGADAVYDASTRMEDALASGTPVDDVAKTIGGSVQHIDAIDAEGKNKTGFPLPNVLDPKNFLMTAFSTPAGKDSKMMDLPSHDGYYVIHVDEVTAPTPKPLLDVRAQVASLWEADQRMTQAQAVADKLIADMGASGDAATVAFKDKRVTFAKLGPVNRYGEGVDIAHTPDAARISPQFLDKLFAAKVGDTMSAPVTTGVVVARLKDISEPKAVGDLANAREELNQSVRAEMGGNLAELMGRSFGMRYPVEVDQKALDDIAGNR